MRFFLLFLVLINLSYAISENVKPSKYKDFGIEGEAFEIIEPDFEKILRDEFKKLKLTKKEVKKQILKSIKKASIFNSDINLCTKNNNSKWEKDYYISNMDLYNPLGRIWKKAGSKVLAPAFPDGIVKNLCFIEGKNLIVAKNQIEFFQKKMHDCLYLVNNMDVRELIKNYPNEKIFPNQAAIKERFDLKCLPASITFKEDLRKLDYYDYEYFKTEN